MLIPAIISLIPCNAGALLEADLCVRLLLYEVSEPLSSRAESLRLEMAERTGVDGGKLLSLDSSLSLTGASFTARGSISLLGATTDLLLKAISTEFAMVPRENNSAKKKVIHSQLYIPQHINSMHRPH